MNGPIDLPEAVSARYRVEKELGRGGMGRVVEAFDRMIRRRVAIKIAPAPPPGDLEQQLAFERFRHEAQFAGSLDHKNIVGIHDFGADQVAAWMVMELVEGGSLRDLLRRTEAFSLAETVRIVVRLLDGLAHCHDQGIAHCDVKPANIMLTEPSSAGEVKLADFGIAHRFRVEHEDPEATRVVLAESSAEPVRLGTPAYMAPEQFAGGHIDARTDIWAVGVVLYQLLTREQPFKGSVAEIEEKVLRSEPIPPSQLSVLANSAIDNIVRKALSKRPQDRFQDARSFGAALLEAERALQGGTRPGTAATPPPLKPSPLTPAPSKVPGWVKLAAGGGVAVAIAGAAAYFVLGDAPSGREERVAARPVVPQPPPPPAPPLLSPAPTQPSPPDVPPAAPGARSEHTAPPPLIPAPEPAPIPTPASTDPPAPMLPAEPLPALPDPPPPVSTAELQAQRMEEALRDLSARNLCGVIEPRRDGNGITVEGFLHQRLVGSLREALAATGFSSRIDAEIFDAPFCGVLDALRPVLAEPRDLPGMTPRERRIRGGERLTLDFAMPAWSATINLWFVMHDGSTVYLLQDHPMQAGERRSFDESSPDFPWMIEEPYGHELVILLASEGPLFRSAPPLQEKIETLAPRLQAAVRQAQDQRRRVLSRAVMVETRP